MKTILKLEIFGDNIRQYLRLRKIIIDATLGNGFGRVFIGNIPPSCWVAEITGLDPKYKFSRNFLSFKKDYSEANSVGSRGVYAYYYLDHGKIYEVKHQVSWKRSERYFCRVEDGKIIEIGQEKVKECLKNRLA